MESQEIFLLLKIDIKIIHFLLSWEYIYLMNTIWQKKNICSISNCRHWILSDIMICYCSLSSVWLIHIKLCSLNYICNQENDKHLSCNQKFFFFNWKLIFKMSEMTILKLLFFYYRKWKFLGYFHELICKKKLVNLLIWWKKIFSSISNEYYLESTFLLL